MPRLLLLLRSRCNPCVLLLVLSLLCLQPAKAQANSPAKSETKSQPTLKAKLLVTNAYIFSMAYDQREPFHGYLVVANDGRLTTVAPGEPPSTLKAAATWNANGHWILPGFISAHSHLWQSAYRGLASSQTLTGWITELYGKQSSHATAEDLYWFTLEGSLDHLRHGITAAYNFSLGGHTPDQSLAFNQQEFNAELASGIRFVHGWQPGHVAQTNTVEQTRENLKAFLDWSAPQRQNPRVLSVMINGMTSFVPRDDAPQEAALEVSLMREFHLGNQTHYLEPPETEDSEQALFPLFVHSGMLSDQLIFGHFIHTTPEILAATGSAHAAMSWNPLSNGRLASGTADIPAYLKAGIRVGMGVDGEASADLADPFENMRTGLYAIRDMYQSAYIMTPYDVLRLQTMGSADVLGVSDRLGSLETGKFADFLVVDPTHFGVVFDPYATLVLAASEPDLERVYVGGQLQVERGTLLHQDLRHVEAEVNRRVSQEATKSQAPESK
jgi:5-methylthioadenosine/S-adenosylhomocysteine deaminase